jgi:hypothetical protein
MRASFVVMVLLLWSGCRKEIMPIIGKEPCNYTIVEFTGRLDALTKEVAVFERGKYSIKYNEVPKQARDSLEMTALYQVYLKQIISGDCEPFLGSIRKIGPALE